MIRILVCLSIVLALPSCGLIDYHPYDGRLSSDTETDINRKNIRKIEEQCKGKDTVRFIMISDTQRSYDETNDFVKLFNIPPRSRERT